MGSIILFRNKHIKKHEHDVLGNLLKILHTLLVMLLHYVEAKNKGYFYHNFAIVDFVRGFTSFQHK